MRYWRVPLDAESIDAPHGDVQILADQCKGCGFCVEYCPCGVLEMSTEFNRKGYHPPVVVTSGQCVSCDLCEMICQEFAIFSIASSGAEQGEDRAEPALAVLPQEVNP